MYDNYHNKYYGVFENSEIQEVELPATLKRLEYGAFQNCQSLTFMEFPEGLEYIGDGCFKESGIQKITLNRHLKKMGQAAFCGCKSLYQIALDRCPLEIISAKCFQESGLEEITIPRSVVEI